MKKNSRKQIFSVTVAALIAVLFLILLYQVANYRIPITDEKNKLQLFEKIRAICFGSPQMETADSVIMIDVHYDKQLVVERDEGIPNGMVPVTNRDQLLQLLTFLNKRQDYRYIMLDIFLGKGVRQENDTTLYHLISKMPRIVIAKPMQEEIADSCLLPKAGTAQYSTAIWENDFVKFQYQTDSTKSMPLMMYEELTGRRISKLWDKWFTDKGLARNSVILTYEFCDEDMSWDLGTGLLGKTIDDMPNTPELENLDTKGKYILIGDFEDDRHQTFLFDMSGTSILFNAYLTLLHQHHLISLGLIILIFMVFWVLAWLTITQNKRFEWLCSFIGIPIYLFLLSLVIYLIFREAYDVLVATTLFWILKITVKVIVLLYQNLPKILSTFKSVKDRIMKRLFIIALLLLTIGTDGNAKRLTILELRNCTSIKVGKTKVKKGDHFDSSQPIHWNKGRQMVLVEDEHGKKDRLTHKGFQKHNATTPDQYFIAEQALGTRGHGLPSDYYTRHDYYLTTNKADTLMFPVKSRMTAEMHAEAVWKDSKGHDIVSPIDLTPERQFFIITPRIWKGRKPQDVILTIRETTNDGNWTDNIYQGLHIVIP